MLHQFSFPCLLEACTFKGMFSTVLRISSSKCRLSGDVRYTYKHSIIQKAEGGQRLSVLIRVSKLSMFRNLAGFGSNYIGFSDVLMNVTLECHDDKPGLKLLLAKNAPESEFFITHNIWRIFGGTSGPFLSLSTPFTGPDISRRHLIFLSEVRPTSDSPSKS